MRIQLATAALLAIASLLASGCCCPMLSGRYCDYRCCPGAMPPGCDPGMAAYGNNAPYGSCGPACAPHCCCLCKLLFPGLAGGGVPSEQGPDYLSPHANFHPVPTRPVFEAVPAYSPPERISTGGSNPLRWSTGTIATARPACIP
jgi:hypothetical protein